MRGPQDELPSACFAGLGRNSPQSAAGAGRLRADVLPLERLAAATTEWRALAASAIEPNVFYEPAFALAAAPVFGRNVFAVTIKSGGDLVGLFPVQIVRRYGVPPPVLAGWTHPFAPLGVPLVAREEAGAVLDAWLDHVSGSPLLPKIVLLPLLPEDGPFAAELECVLKRRSTAAARFGRHQRALLCPDEHRAGYLEHGLDGKRRKERRRRMRRLKTAGELAFDYECGEDDISVALRHFLLLEASGWKGRAGTAILSRPDVAAFVEKAIQGLAATHQARVDRMLLDGRPIASTLTLSSGDTAWFWKTAYDETFRKHSPGLQLAAHLTAELLRDPSISRADSCAAGGHPMIDRLWRERLTVSDRLLCVRPEAGIVFSFACRMERLRRAAIAAVRAMRQAMKRTS